MGLRASLSDNGDEVMPLYRSAFLVLGIILLAVGYVGTVTPGLPGFVFILGALFCFKKSSKRLEGWMLNNRLFGPTLRDWEKHGAISKRIKIISIGTMWTAVAISLFVVETLWLKSTIVALAVIGTWYIASRPLPLETTTAA